MTRVRRLRAWLSEPVEPGWRRDTTDWQRLGSSFGRMVGGAHRLRQTRHASGRPLGQGRGDPATAGRETDRPLGLSSGRRVYVIGMVSAATAFVWYLSSLPPPSGTHH